MLSLGVLQAGAATSVAVPAWMAEYSTVAKTSVCCTRRERISWIPSLIVLNVKKMLQWTDGQVFRILIAEKTNDCS